MEVIIVLLFCGGLVLMHRAAARRRWVKKSWARRYQDHHSEVASNHERGK